MLPFLTLQIMWDNPADVEVEASTGLFRFKSRWGPGFDLGCLKRIISVVSGLESSRCSHIFIHFRDVWIPKFRGASILVQFGCSHRRTLRREACQRMRRQEKRELPWNPPNDCSNRKLFIIFRSHFVGFHIRCRGYRQIHVQFIICATDLEFLTVSSVTCRSDPSGQLLGGSGHHWRMGPWGFAKCEAQIVGIRCGVSGLRSIEICCFDIFWYLGALNHQRTFSRALGFGI